MHGISFIVQKFFLFACTGPRSLFIMQILGGETAKTPSLRVGTFFSLWHALNMSK